MQLVRQKPADSHYVANEAAEVVKDNLRVSLPEMLTIWTTPATVFSTPMWIGIVNFAWENDTMM